MQKKCKFTTKNLELHLFCVKSLIYMQTKGLKYRELVENINNEILVKILNKLIPKCLTLSLTFEEEIHRSNDV